LGRRFLFVGKSTFDCKYTAMYEIIKATLG
jgi:hypothetical protein